MASQTETAIIVLSFFFAIFLVHILLKYLLRKPAVNANHTRRPSRAAATEDPHHKSNTPRTRPRSTNMLAPSHYPSHVPVPPKVVHNTPPHILSSSAFVPPKLKKKPESWPVKQPHDAYLVLDVEATCMQGTDFNWPNEIIEWPVCLLRWQDKDREGRASKLVVVDEFRSFVKPTWKPQLTDFCTSLTGITQADVDHAPTFPKALAAFANFLTKHGLIDAGTGKPLQRFTWCTDGPFDIRDFVVKQCFISKISMPEWLKGDVLDVRKSVGMWLTLQNLSGPSPKLHPSMVPRRPSLNISQQLHALELSAFKGRQHSGIDDTRNIARIVTELGRRGVRLEPNTAILPGRRWQWMGKPGQVLEEYCLT